MYMYMNINMCICKLQLYPSCSFGGGLCRFNQASLKNLADLGFHCTHWLLRVAQEEHSCARGFGAGCVQSSTPSGVFGATNIQQRFSSLSMLHSSEWTCDLLWSSDTASVSNDEGMDLRWRHACNFSCSFRFRLSFQVESSKPVFGFEQVTRVTVLFSYPFSEIGKPKAAIFWTKQLFTVGALWPNQFDHQVDSFGGLFWCPIVAFTSHNNSYHLLPPSASAMASRLSRCMGGPMGKSMRLTESPAASVSLVSPRGLHPVSHFLWHESPGHVRHVHIFYNILHSLTPLSLRISKWAKLEFRVQLSPSPTRLAW